MAETKLKSQAFSPNTDHITLTPATDKFVKIAILEQISTGSTTNTYKNNAVILTGKKLVTITSGGALGTGTVTFGITFTAAPIVLLTPNVAANIYANDNENAWGYVAGAASTTAFDIKALTREGNVAANREVIFGWIAIGTLT